MNRPAPVNLISAQLEQEIRQRRVVVPSRVGSDFWFGYDWHADGFSRQQRLRLEQGGADLAKVVSHTVFVADDGMIVRNTNDRHPPYRAIRCPVVGRVGARLKIITPNGVTKLVWPDGYLSAPKPVTAKRVGGFNGR